MSEKIKAMFDKFEDDYSTAPEPERPWDLCAFNLLNALVPGHMDMVSCAEHDEIWLAVTPEELEAAGVTEEQVLQLVRWGVRYDDCLPSLAMFV